MHKTKNNEGVPEDLGRTLRRLALDLKQAEQLLGAAGLPQKTLEELSETVDHFRHTTWSVLNTISDEFSDPERAPTLLTAHRIQRTRALLLALNAEMDTGHISGKTPAAHELSAALGATYKKLHYILHGKAIPPDER